MGACHLICAVFVTTLVTGSSVTPSASFAQAPAPARETYADLPGVRIWYRDTGGTGVPVVLLHATTGSSRVWEHQFPVLTENGFDFGNEVAEFLNVCIVSSE